MSSASTSASSTSSDEHFIRPYTTLTGETIETIWLPSSAKEARAKGETLYWTGKQCLRGHVAPRYASTGACVRCKRERDRSPEAREQRREYQRRYYAENREQECARSRRYYVENREQRREYNRRYYAENREKVREYNRQWIEENPDHRAAILGKAHANERYPGSVPEGFDIEPTIPVYAEARRLTEETGEQYHVDHAVPLSLGGRHEASNLRVCRMEENRAKGRIEQRLVEAINSDSPLDNYHTVYADVKGDLTELVGTVLRNRIYLAGLRLAKEAEARLSDEEAA